jgi:3-methyladenine DNA glycosylase AlkC
VCKGVRERIIIEVSADFNYMFQMPHFIARSQRRGARRRSDVPSVVLQQLAGGTTETVNLMEWLAADMPALALSLAAWQKRSLADTLRRAAEEMAGRGITERLRIAGNAIARVVGPSAPEFRSLAAHTSDIVRQWACYAVNSAALNQGLETRLTNTLPFAADRNMSVREAAWMAFRPHLHVHLTAGLGLLEPISRANDPNLRRFAVEVTRPRSVWGAHIDELKRSPELALPLLENVRQDPIRYVQLAVGNWLNDASKSRPEWVREVCDRWMRHADRSTEFIVKRGLRTIERVQSSGRHRLGPQPRLFPRRNPGG